MAERYTEQTMRHARLQRDALESIDKAWAARTITATRVAALVRQLAADKKAIAAYRKEYELGQRSLIDLLNAENQYFNAAVSLTSSRGVIVFADYQLLAAMGSLLEYLKTAPPVDAAPLDVIPLGLLPTKLPPIIVSLPPTGSAPLNVAADPAPVEVNPAAPPVIIYGERWQRWSGIPGINGAKAWLAQKGQATDNELPVALTAPENDTRAMSFASSEAFEPRQTGTPRWLGIALQGIKTNP
jgi:adhesin transport system outer membrane protein